MPDSGSLRQQTAACAKVDRGLTLETAMDLYGLEHSEPFWEKALDTKLLIAWNRERIVVAFRGTVSLPNALADVQVSHCAQLECLNGSW